jgi:MFS family permease
MTVTKQQLESNIWKFYLTRIELLAFISPIVAIYLLSKGLSLTQVFTLQAFFGIMIASLELPTGAISDLIGRKYTLFLSSVSLTIALFVYGFIGKDFMTFLLAEFFIALGLTLLSGTDSAFVYDTLRKLKKTDEYKRIFSNGHSVKLVTSSVIVAISGILSSISFDLMFLVATSVGVLVTLSHLLLVEPPYKRAGFSASKYISQMKTNVVFTFTHKRVRWLTMFSGIFGTMMLLCFWYYQPYMKAVNLDLVYFGFAFSGMNLTAAIASKLTVKFENKFGELLSLIIITALPLISLFLMGTVFATAMVLAIYLQQISRGFNNPLITAYINDHLKHTNRATVLSMSGLISRLGAFIVLPVFGYLIDAWSLAQSMLFAGVMFSIIFLIAFLVKPKD